MRSLPLVLAIWFVVTASVCPASAQTAIAPTDPSPLILVHYMPWFGANPAAKKWGWHWTMNHFHPDQITNGQPDLASHYHPLVGPYDSDDPDLLECQVLLMKFAGIDGLLIDWYGTDDYLDYGTNHRNTQHMIAMLKRAGLKYAIVYEDSTVPGLIAAKRLSEADGVAHGQALLQWMQTHWFPDASYLKIGDRPVLLDFGSGYYQTDQWNQIFAPLPHPPALFTESHLRPPAVGAFDWPQPGQGTENSFREMDGFYTEARSWTHFIPTAFPRFHDIYEQAGVQKSWGTIEDRAGKTYEETLERALKSGVSLIQVATWNDWGEGTQIEPSVEFGYRDLETTQRLRRQHIRTPFAYTAQDLRLPIELYQLKKRLASDPKAQTALKAISNLLFAGELDQTRKRLKAAEKMEHGTRGGTLLLLAVSFGTDSQGVQALLDAGADPNARDSAGTSALMHAAARPSVQMVQALLAKGANPDLQDRNGKTAFMAAASGATARVLAGALHKPNLHDRNGDTALMEAARALNPDVAETLLQKGADVHAHNHARETALSLVTRALRSEGSTDGNRLVQLLLAHGAAQGLPANDRDPEGQTPLIALTLANDLDRVKALIAQGAKLDIRNNAGETALWLAVFKGYSEIALFLLDKGADPNAHDKLGVTALMRATARTPILTALLDRGAVIDARDQRGMTALMYAAWGLHGPSVRLLVERGADVNADDAGGGTALHYATGTNDTETMGYLLAHGSHVNSARRNGFTPLFSAVIQESAVALQVLLAHGAAVNARMQNGDTPLRVAQHNHSDRMIALLEAAGAKE